MSESTAGRLTFPRWYVTATEIVAREFYCSTECMSCGRFTLMGSVPLGGALNSLVDTYENRLSLRVGLLSWFWIRPLSMFDTLLNE